MAYKDNTTIYTWKYTKLIRYLLMLKVLQQFTLHFRYQIPYPCILAWHFYTPKNAFCYTHSMRMTGSLAFLLSNTSFSLFTSQSHVSSFIKPKIIVKFNLIYSQNVSTCTCIVSRTKYMFVLICVTCCIPHTTTLRKSQTIPTNIWSSIICNDENVASAVCISVGYCVCCVCVCMLSFIPDSRRCVI